MSRRRDPFGWPARAWLEIRRGSVAFLAVGLLLAMMLAYYLHQDWFLGFEGEPTEAQIVSLTLALGSKSQLQGPVVVIVARSKDGLTGSDSVASNLAKGCKVGDTIPATVVKGRLRIEPRGCREGIA